MDQNSPDSRPRFFLLGGGSSSELLRIGSILRKETVGGALLVTATIIALIWANSPLSAGYFQLRGIRVGYGPWHLELSLSEWASDGLLAIFLFLVGLELKREFRIGDLRECSKSVVPAAACASRSWPSGARSSGGPRAPRPAGGAQGGIAERLHVDLGDEAPVASTPSVATYCA
jgi:hypothetical protein